MDGVTIEKALKTLPPEAKAIVRMFQREHENLERAVQTMPEAEG